MIYNGFHLFAAVDKCGMVHSACIAVLFKKTLKGHIGLEPTVYDCALLVVVWGVEHISRCGEYLKSTIFYRI